MTVASSVDWLCMLPHVGSQRCESSLLTSPVFVTDSSRCVGTEAISAGRARVQRNYRVAVAPLYVKRTEVKCLRTNLVGA